MFSELYIHGSYVFKVLYFRPPCFLSLHSQGFLFPRSQNVQVITHMACIMACIMACTHMARDTIFPGHYVPRVLCLRVIFTHGPIFPGFNLPGYQFLQGHIVSRLYIYCIYSEINPRPFISVAPCFQSLILPGLYVLRIFYNNGPVFSGSYLPRALCSQGLIVSGPYASRALYF